MEEVKNAVEKVAENVEYVAVKADDMVTYTRNGMFVGFAVGVASVYSAYYGLKLCGKIIDETSKASGVLVDRVKQKRKLKKDAKKVAKTMQEEQQEDNVVLDIEAE